MEEIIYLAVVVGWFLLNAYKKSQAKKQQEQQQAPQHRRQQPQERAPEQPSTMEELMRQLMGEEQRVPVPVVPTPTPAPRPVHIRVPISVSHTPPVRTSRLTPRTRSRSQTVRTKEPRGTVEQVAVKVHADERFDLRNAIAYSAILQRPYA
ncbi:MAG: hypothetical protein K9J06_04900 [Flavobacteriales bacterium]|nr:hypothetical protein [Flavobacteriales bacterium]